METTTCPHCGLQTDASRLFCVPCGRVRKPADLQNIRLMRPFGYHSNNPKMQEFMHGPNAGDETIFDRP